MPGHNGVFRDGTSKAWYECDGFKCLDLTSFLKSKVPADLSLGLRECCSRCANPIRGSSSSDRAYLEISVRFAIDVSVFSLFLMITLTLSLLNFLRQFLRYAIGARLLSFLFLKHLLFG